jgi:hypothetical protein
MNSSQNLESSVMITECYFPKATAMDDPDGRANNANSLAAAMDDQDAEQITLIR